jgi:starch-binding outer membrane protein, SusD/RagB family
MRKHTAAMISAALMGGLAACMDLGEDLTGLTNQAYGTRAVFEALVNATYEPLRSFWAQERGFTVTEFGTDIFTKGADGSHKYINDYSSDLNPDAAFFRDTWNDFYRAINTANAAIGQAPVVEMESALKAQRLAEARFLRALYYFVLVQMYGPLHLALEEAKTVTTEARRASVDQVYEAILDDLRYAEATLDYVAKDYGRVTKGAAQHLLAKVYLTRLRDADAASDEAGKRQAGDFANAADWALKVINSGHYALLPRFADVFDFFNERNPEVIWSVQFTIDPLTTGNGSRGHLYFLMEYDILPGMSRDIANGRPFKRFRPTTFFLSLYDRTKDSRYEAQFTRTWYANNATTIPKDAAGAPKFGLGDTAVYVSHTDADAGLAAIKPYRVYTPKTYTNRVFPSLNKFHDPYRLSVNDERGSRDFPIFRLAETEVIAAEALLRDGRPAEGLEHINRVRRRAAIPGQELAMELTVDQLTLDAILDERAREFAGEMMRWFDLARTHQLLARVKAYNSDARNNIQPYHVLRPIPQTQIDRTSTPFPQNPGY